MSSGDSHSPLEIASRCRLVTIEAACAASGARPNAMIKRLAHLVDVGKLVKAPFIPPRCYWARRPLGAQGLILGSSILHRCFLTGPRIWMPGRRDGPATIISCDGEQEATFVDFGAEARNVARKLARYCDERALSGLTALGIVVPTAHKAEAIHRAVEDSPLPIRYFVSNDLGSSGIPGGYLTRRLIKAPSSALPRFRTL